VSSSYCTLYLVIGIPPSLSGAAYETSSFVESPGNTVAVTLVGLPATCGGGFSSAGVVSCGWPRPRSFLATTRAR
jgi:hypothetical protein